MSIRRMKAGFAILLLLAFVPTLYSGFSTPPTWEFHLPPTPKVKDQPSPFYHAGFIETEVRTRSVHSPAIAELSNGNLLAVWYGGTREGARDVAIYRSFWNKETGKWSEGQILTGPQDTQKDLGIYIKKVGNPVLVTDLSGRVWLFYVSVSFGGWSGSSLNYRISEDHGTHWSKARRLVTSPFLNISTLVRGTPFLYRDGSIGLPVYHEFLGKFGELLRVAPDGKIIDKTRISWGKSSLQPSIVPLDPLRAAAFLRYSGDSPRRVLYSETGDGGRRWSPPEKLPLPNPDASIMGMRTPDGSLWLVFNDSEKDRDSLSLARSRDNGRSWDRVHIFEKKENEEGSGRAEFSYPFWIQTGDGMIHLVYTWNRKRIRHVSFNPSWLEGLR